MYVSCKVRPARLCCVEQHSRFWMRLSVLSMMHCACCLRPLKRLAQSMGEVCADLDHTSLFINSL